MIGRNHFKSLGGRVSAVLARFRRQRHGAVAPILALALIPIIGCMGFASEVSNWWLTQRMAQNAADSAVLAAAIDAGANMNGSTYPTSTPTNNLCTTVPSSSASWYCQAISTAAGYHYSRSTTVKVEPAVVTCPVTVTSTQCYQVSITKYVPIYLVGVLGYHGDATIGAAHYQKVTASALAAAPGPPIDFCLLTTNGDLIGKGTPKANLNGCDTFSNGKTNCTGSNGFNAGASYASGANGGGCAPNGPNIGSQQYQCDPYGAISQTFPYNDGTQGSFTESCPNATNASANVPAAPAGCTAASAKANSNNDGTGNFPSTNVITQADINGTATGANPGANATTTTVGGVSMQVIQVCGTAALSTSAPTSAKAQPPSCSSTPLGYDPTQTTKASTSNLLIVVYDGGLDMNGCTLANATPGITSGVSYGGMTIVFAPITQSAGQTCDVVCVPQVSNASGSTGTIQDAAPLNGPFSGVAIMQSEFFASDSGCGNGSGNKAGPVDWCNAGNQPTLDLQGLVYFPQADMAFAGAISKFQPNALNCIGWIVAQFETNGTGAILNNNSWTSSITGQCSQAGVTLPGVPHTHTFYQALVG